MHYGIGDALAGNVVLFVESRLPSAFAVADIKYGYAQPEFVCAGCRRGRLPREPHIEWKEQDGREQASQLLEW